MVFLKAIQTSFTPIHHLVHKREYFQRRRVVLSLSKSNDSDNSDSEGKAPEGDTRKQELLARIAMLQTQKVRLTDYLDERSEYLTQFAEEANAEIDQIGENALRELDEAGARIMENIESQMQAFEESAESNKLEIEKNEQTVTDFEDQIHRDRNEGLFFKNLKPKTPIEVEKTKEETDKIRELTKKNAGSVTRRNIYLALIGLVVIGIIEASIDPSDWRKAAVLGIILVGLLSQLIYEQNANEENK
ncbi:unnamed protein product [Fraxinus pennsylvanica]|uniref:8-amino-7-oxononanoate synthase n=1 Tax=Fraxinus pennsylvanica TaxID=56036 RepID=A0AAD1Z2W5_9LAMI|nr:unnamed protein product [Fraxinus pennsylvanica]